MLVINSLLLTIHFSPILIAPTIVVLIYVDDIIITGNNQLAIQGLLSFLQFHFHNTFLALKSPTIQMAFSLISVNILWTSSPKLAF